MKKIFYIVLGSLAFSSVNADLYNVVILKEHNKYADKLSVIEKDYKTCKEVFDDGMSIGNGNYTLTINGSSFENYCDMDSGGLTLVMHLKNSGQLSGSYKDTFWSLGANLDSNYGTSEFTSLKNTEMGFMGWDRIKELNDNTNLELTIKGINSNGDSVNENYSLKNFSPNFLNNTIDTDIMDEGLYTITKMGDIDAYGTWGSCGVYSGRNHFGFGLCTKGRNNSVPYGNEVQIWHYSLYNQNLNVSFGSDSSLSNYTYNRNTTYDFYMYMK